MTLTPNETTVLLWLLGTLISVMFLVFIWFIGRVNKAIDTLEKLTGNLKLIDYILETQEKQIDKINFILKI